MRQNLINIRNFIIYMGLLGEVAFIYKLQLADLILAYFSVCVDSGVD